MVKGIGVDITQISRIEKLMANPRFAQRILTEAECTLLEKQPKQAQWLAARFAVKEAVSKALGVGLSKCPPNEVETLYDKMGAPKVVLYGKALEIMQRINATRIHVSITHEAQYAVAMIVIE